MGALSIVLIVILALVGLAWVLVRNVLWGAVFVVTGLFLMASFGLLWWWVPIVGAIGIVIGALIALLFKSAAGRTFLTAVATLGVLVAVIAGVLSGIDTANASAGGSSKLSEESKNLLAKSLTVTTTSAEAKCQVDDMKLVSYKVGALEGTPPRKWSDALSTPFAATEAEAIRDELQQSICKDPLLGVSYLTFFATDIRDALKVSTGVDIVELNPWLKPFAADPSNINKKATEFIPLLNVEEPTSSEMDAAIVKNREWQKEASYVNTLLDRFALAGVAARPSVANYHLAAGGLVVGALPAVERNSKQENLPALIFSLTEKGQCDELLSAGANTGDKRPELFEAKKCEVTPPGGTTPPGPTPPPGSPPGTPPTIPPVVPPTTPPTTPPCTDCKDWEESVDPPAGVDPQPNDDYEEPIGPAVDPAPVLPGGDSSSGTDTPAQGADPSSNIPVPAPATGTTDGGTGSVSTPDSQTDGTVPKP